MKLLILSDTHGLTKEVTEVLSRHRVDHIFHNGDFCTDRHQPPFPDMQLVRGNCDHDLTVNEERIIQWDGLRIYQTHGHLYDVKRTLNRLAYRAEELEANLILFGHSHVSLCVEHEGRLFLNPGSLQSPRNTTTPTYAMVEKGVEDQGKIALHVTFYSSKGDDFPQLGGQYTVRASP